MPEQKNNNTPTGPDTNTELSKHRKREKILEFEAQLSVIMARYKITYQTVMDLTAVIAPTSLRMATTLPDTSSTQEKYRSKTITSDLFSLIEKYDTPYKTVIKLAKKIDKSNTISSKFVAVNPEKTRRYLNPYTGAIIVTKKQTPHKILCAWKLTYGKLTVDSWLVDER
ncbi:hypothetical protein [Pseudomonas mohnii]